MSRRTRQRVTFVRRETPQKVSGLNVGRSYFSAGDPAFRWIIAGALLVLLMIVAGALIFLRGCVAEPGPESSPAPEAAITPMPTATPSAHVTPAPTATPNPEGKSEAAAYRWTGDVKTLKSKEKNINQPGIFEDEIVYSAGSGSVSSEMVLKTLFVQNVTTGEEKEIAKAQVKNGEIYETLMNDRWIVWVDTDQLGTNIIMCYDRKPELSENREEQIWQVKQLENRMPTLVLSGNYLLFTEENEEGDDRVNLFYLEAGEPTTLAQLTDPAAYGVSAPSIAGTEIIWAAHDPDQSQADRELGERSAIYYCYTDRLANYYINPETFFPVFPYWRPYMYVHQPVTNGNLEQPQWAWLDTNGAPDGSLWLRAGDTTRIAEGGITTFGLTDNYLVYGHHNAVYAYNIREKTYTKLSEDSEKAVTPAVSGNRVTWFTDTDGNGYDQLKTLLLP